VDTQPETPAAARSGRLEDTPFPRLLLELAAASFTGELAVARGREKARIAWLRGMPVSCDLEPAAAGLVELLVARGGLPAADGDRVRAAQVAKSCSEEAALLGLAKIAPRELVLARRELLGQRLVALGRFETGDFRAGGDAPPAASELLRIDPLPVVQRLLAAHWRPDRMLADLEPRLRLFPSQGPACAPLLARLDKSPGLEDLAATLSGERSAWGLVAGASDRARIEALWILDVSGALVWSETAAAPAAAEGTDAQSQVPAGPEIEIEVVGGPARDARPAAAAARAARAEAAEDSRAAELRAEIADKRGRLGELDHYALLGVARNVSAGDLKRAYLKAAKRFHPDALSRLGLEDLKRDANELFAAITRAHDVLSDAERRGEYDAGLAGHVQVDGDRVAQAEGLYRRAEMMMRAGQFAGALDLVQGAVNLWPEDPAYQGALGWCLYKKSPPDEARAREHLEKAVALDPKEAVAHLRLGIVLKAMGDAAGAARATGRARQLDPKAKA
jgi:tetratricopeptide (TPR) repeat protein